MGSCSCSTEGQNILINNTTRLIVPYSATWRISLALPLSARQETLQVEWRYKHIHISDMSTAVNWCGAARQSHQRSGSVNDRQSFSVSDLCVFCTLEVILEAERTHSQATVTLTWITPLSRPGIHQRVKAVVALSIHTPTHSSSGKTSNRIGSVVVRGDAHSSFLLFFFFFAKLIISSRVWSREGFSKLETSHRALKWCFSAQEAHMFISCHLLQPCWSLPASPCVPEVYFHLWSEVAS